MFEHNGIYEDIMGIMVLPRYMLYVHRQEYMRVMFEVGGGDCRVLFGERERERERTEFLVELCRTTRVLFKGCIEKTNFL